MARPRRGLVGITSAEIAERAEVALIGIQARNVDPSTHKFPDRSKDGRRSSLTDGASRIRRADQFGQSYQDDDR